MNRNTKKGFTIVELIIVIAVIAVLAAVLIPTFSNLINQAQQAKDTALVSDLNKGLKMSGKEFDTMHDALTAVEENVGINVAKINAVASESEILWDSVNQCFVYSKNGKINYIPDTQKTPIGENEQYKYWQIVSTPDSGNKYSQYISNSDYTVDTLTVSTGFDAGLSKGIATLKYENTGAAQNVVIRTNSYDIDLIIDAAQDTVKHYDLLGNLTIENVKGESYHEFGKVERVSIKNGRFVAEDGAELGSEVTQIEGGTALVEVAKAAIWETTYDWSEDNKTCTATRKDKNGVKAEETEEGVVVEEITKEATTTEAGSKTYTATFTNPAFTTQTKTETIARLLTAEEELLNSINEELAQWETNNNRKPYTMHEALSALGNQRGSVMSNADTFLWDSKENKFYTLDEVKSKISGDNGRKSYEFWKITSATLNSSYSNYLADGYSGAATINCFTGFDVGNNTLSVSVKFVPNISGELIIRTNGNEVLTITKGMVFVHYGTASKVDISGPTKASSKLKYVEKGNVEGFIKVSGINVTVDLSLIKLQAAKGVVVQKSSTTVLGNNLTPICYTTSTKPSGISGVANGNDIGKVYLKGLELFDEGFGTSAKPFVVNSAEDWKKIDSCDTTNTIYIQLKNNFTVETLVTTVARNAKIILDLNGHTITLKNDSMVQVGGKGLTIKDSVGNGGFIKSESNGVRGLFASFDDSATLTIDGGIFNGNYLVGKSANAETKMAVTVNGGTFKLDALIYSEITKTTISIKGGTFNIDVSDYSSSTSSND